MLKLREQSGNCLPFLFLTPLFEVGCGMEVFIILPQDLHRQPAVSVNYRLFIAEIYKLRYGDVWCGGWRDRVAFVVRRGH